MSKDFWDDQVSEYELLDEDIEEAEALAEEYDKAPVVIEATEDELEEIQEESSFVLDNEESNTIYNARLRLEQARLYEMIINHNIFEGVQADPRAVKVVQDELKHYIIKRLEILMGLRQPIAVKKSSKETFNDVEADFLKHLAYMGTKGASVKSNSETTKPSGLNAIGSKPQNNKLKTLSPSQPTPRQETVQKTIPTQKQVVKRKRRVVAAPSKRKTQQVNTGTKDIVKNTGVAPRNITKQQAEEIAKRDLAELSKRKPFDKMTKAEKLAEMKRVNEKYRRQVPSGAMPQLTPEQERQKYIAQQLSIRPGSRGETNQLIANFLINRKEQGENE